MALILDTDDEIFIAADAADMAKQLVGSSTAGEAQQSVAPVPNDAIKIISGPAKLDETKE